MNKRAAVMTETCWIVKSSLGVKPDIHAVVNCELSILNNTQK